MPSNYTTWERRTSFVVNRRRRIDFNKMIRQVLRRANKHYFYNHYTLDEVFMLKY